MIFRKYNVVVFKDEQSKCRKLQVRGWLPATLLLLFLLLLASNTFLWKFYRDYNGMRAHLLQSEKTVEEQNTQLLSLYQKLKTLEKDLSRIRDFDSKLRVMINLEQAREGSTNSMGGTSNDFSKNYLPFHRQELLARKMHDFLRQLSVDARLEEVRQQDVLHTLRTNKNLLEATPSIMPTHGWTTSTFGWRLSPFTGKREFHKGLDISCPTGTPIYAPARGRVTFVGRDGSYGLTVKIDHGSGMATRYAHMNKATVKANQVVTRGEMIGHVGTTGRSTGPHLHYEVRLNGVPANPNRYIIN